MVEPAKQTILVVEDDDAIMLGLEENLQFEGFHVLKADNGDDGLALALQRKPALIILDVMLPGMTGYEVCKNVREKGLRTPIIMLTAREEEFDKILGFDMGTDDYMTKPFSIRELIARVKAILRRTQVKESDQAIYQFGDFVLDSESRTLKQKGKDVPLTRTEFDLLAYLVANAGKALSRETLMNDVWGSDYFGTQRSLDSFVASLRKKVEKKPAEPNFIQTVHGVGYKFDPGRKS